MNRVALVTCRELPEPDFDEDILIDALRRANLQPELLPWDGDGDPGAYDLCVLRSCWNYFERPEAFLGWIDAAARVTRLANTAGVVRWNLHKRYLSELADAGVPVVPTVWVDRGTSRDVRALITETGWERIVIKPAVSAASFQTRPFAGDDLDGAQSFLDGLASERDVMIQRFMATVETSGERALVYIDGEMTHAVRKLPRFADGIEQVSGALPVSDRERALAESALRCAGTDVMYGRVDVVEDDTGAILVSELELIEPSLFLLQHRPALDRFVAAIGRHCTGK